MAASHTPSSLRRASKCFSALAARFRNSGPKGASRHGLPARTLFTQPLRRGGLPQRALGRNKVRRLEMPGRAPAELWRFIASACGRGVGGGVGGIICLFAQASAPPRPRNTLSEDISKLHVERTLGGARALAPARARAPPWGRRARGLKTPCAPLPGTTETWLILPVVIRLSQRLSHACLSISIIQ